MGDQGSETGEQSRPLLERNEQNVISYYTMAFNDKNPTLAVQQYGGDEYIQHNPLDIKRVFADGDFVITHALLTGAVPVYGPHGSKVVDIFRLDTNGKVVEHWDVIAQISATSENGNPEV